MGTGRIWRKKSLRRPKKSGAARKRRQLEHRRKLIALGVDKVMVATMNPKQVRDQVTGKTPIGTKPRRSLAKAKPVVVARPKAKVKAKPAAKLPAADKPKKTKAE